MRPELHVTADDGGGFSRLDAQNREIV